MFLRNTTTDENGGSGEASRTRHPNFRESLAHRSFVTGCGSIGGNAHGPKDRKEVTDGCVSRARCRCRAAAVPLPCRCRAAAAAVPLPLEQYAHGFDDVFHTHIQHRRFREYLAGLLLPRDRNTTLTALVVGAEPITQAQTAPVQHLQCFLWDADWDAEAVTARRLAGLRADPLTTPHADGALVLDETGDRTDGTPTAHVGSQYVGSIGTLGTGIVAVTSLWADAQVDDPLHVRPYTPAARLAGGTQHPACRTKPQLALELVAAARAAGIPFRAVVADRLYGAHPECTRRLWQVDIPFVLAVGALTPSEVVWTPPPEPEAPWEAADRLRWGPRHDARHPGAWTAVVRRFHAGHEQTWWAVDLRLGGTSGPDRSHRLVVATRDPRTLPQASTWYLVTTLPVPGTSRAAEHPAVPAADRAEVVRLSGLRQWVENRQPHYLDRTHATSSWEA
jgi:hypothetical protein